MMKHLRLEQTRLKSSLSIAFVDCCPTGTVCGTQSSLQAFFEMLSFVAGIYLQDPAQCVWLMLASLFMVLLATILVIIFVVRGGAARLTASGV